MFDKELQFFRALDDKGEFRPRKGFNPCHQTSDYTEGNPWQYAWLVPHDVPGLVECFGGKENFIFRLDSLFLASSELNAEANPDITGLIGQYAHGNEPSHHIIYLYNYVGQPWKTARRVRQVMNELYTDQPAGLCGNEDVGQMSAWYILSALGLYQVEPCGGKWQIGSAIVNDATLHVGDGKTFRITTHKNSAKNIYVQKVLLNGVPVNRTWIDHNDIIRGGTLEIFFGKKPSKWGTL
jgi:predicted alpha-1,2-mannosidase